MSNLVILLCLLLCRLPFCYQRSIDDMVCTSQAIVLCLKDEFAATTTIIQGIINHATEIITLIEQNESFHTLTEDIEREMNYARCYSPVLHYHEQFFLQNNINTKHFNRLLVEAHDTMVLFANSIVELLDSRPFSSQAIDEKFERVHKSLTQQLICRYRDVLKFFSLKWKSSGQIGRLHFSSRSRLSPSFVSDIHPIVLARYLRQSMEQINQVILNLEMKFFIH